jgi:phosphoadenosine phosphosulfate reductase
VAKTMNPEVLAHQAEAETWDAEQVLQWAWDRFGSSASIASSLGAEDVALIDLASRAGTAFPVFTLDTNFLFPETYELIVQIEERYRLTIERLQPKITAKQQGEQFGDELWKRQPDHCCAIRKIEPLRDRLQSSSAWITGIRREQSLTRANAHKLEWDEKFGLVKLNPLANWSEGQVWAYIRSHRVPYNPLHDRSYPSIGCIHCTRAVLPDEDARAGRWSGFTKTECGLHFSEPANN